MSEEKTEVTNLVPEEKPNTTNDNKESNQTENFRPWGMELNQFCMFMHLAQFAGLIVPIANIVLPIVMWTTNKDKSELIDQHGKHILNWMISSFIYFFVSFILMFVIIGFLAIFAVAICSIIFTIMGAIKANNGEVYKYPLSITFIK